MFHRPVTALAALAVGGALFAGPLAAATAAPAPTLAPTMHTLHVGGVALDVPAGWRVDASYGAGCIVDRAARPAPARELPYGVDDCQLRVVTADHLINSVDADDPYFPGDPVVCHSDGRSVRWATTSARAAYVGAADAEFRTWTLPCVARPAEQWFVASPPGVVIQRLRMTADTEAAARAAVRGARLPRAEHGDPRSVTGAASFVGGTTVALAPVRLIRDGYGHSSALPTGTKAVRLDVAGANVSYSRGPGDEQSLTVRQFLDDVRHGFPGVPAGSRVVVNAQSPTGSGVETLRATVVTTAR